MVDDIKREKVTKGWKAELKIESSDKMMLQKYLTLGWLPGKGELSKTRDVKFRNYLKNNANFVILLSYVK